MTRKTILFGLSAIGALVLAGSANAQGVGAAVKATPAVPATPATPAMPDGPGERATPAVPAIPATPAVPAAPSASGTGADVSATARGRSDFPAGTVVRDSAGVEIGTVMDPDPAMSASGRVTVKTSTGFITVPRGSLTLDGGVAVSKQGEAELRASGKTKTE